MNNHLNKCKNFYYFMYNDVKYFLRIGETKFLKDNTKLTPIKYNNKKKFLIIDINNKRIIIDNVVKKSY